MKESRGGGGGGDSLFQEKQKRAKKRNGRWLPDANVRIRGGGGGEAGLATVFL